MAVFKIIEQKRILQMLDHETSVLIVFDNVVSEFSYERLLNSQVLVKNDFLFLCIWQIWACVQNYEFKDCDGA